MKLKLCHTTVMAVVNHNIIRTCYSVSSVNQLDIVLISVKKKSWNTHEELCKAIYELSKPSQPKCKSDSEDNNVYVSHLTPSQQSKVVQLVGKLNAAL